MTANKKYPGKFMLSYLIGGSSTQGKVKHESMSVTPEGIRFRGRVFGSTDDLISWFKLNFDSRA
jgi:hypothetical protein